MAPIKSWQLEAADSESLGSRLASHADTIIYASVERRWRTQRQRRKNKDTKTQRYKDTKTQTVREAPF